MAKSALEAHGISTAIAADDGGGAGIAMSLYRPGVELRLARADRSEARQVLGVPERVAASPQARPMWVVMATGIIVLLAATLLILQVVTS